MTIALDHMSIAAKDKVATANFYAHLFGVTYGGLRRTYASVVVNEGLTLNFEDAETIERRHYAFRVSGEEFEAARGRLAEAGVPFGSLDTDLDGTVYERGGRRGFYFNDLNGHGCEIITRA